MRYLLGALPRGLTESALAITAALLVVAGAVAPPTQALPDDSQPVQSSELGADLRVELTLDRAEVAVGEALTASWTVSGIESAEVVSIRFVMGFVEDGRTLNTAYLDPTESIANDTDAATLVVPQGLGDSVYAEIWLRDSAEDTAFEYAQHYDMTELIPVVGFDSSGVDIFGTLTTAQATGCGHYSDGRISTGWFKSNGYWYHADSTGFLDSGWIQEGNAWYYLDLGDSRMLAGWAHIGGTWYYFNTSGAMQTGWAHIGGTWYYFNTSGAMQTGWAHIGGTWYYFNTSGAMQTGWAHIGGTWYYFNTSGAMQASRWVTEGRSSYYLGSSGALQSTVTYKNCSAVRAAGKAPLLAGQPGYGSHLDRDGDGIACEAAW